MLYNRPGPKLSQTCCKFVKKLLDFNFTHYWFNLPMKKTTNFNQNFAKLFYLGMCKDTVKDKNAKIKYFYTYIVSTNISSVGVSVRLQKAETQKY